MYNKIPTRMEIKRIAGKIGRFFLVNGSFKFILAPAGNSAKWVNVFPNWILTTALALIA